MNSAKTTGNCHRCTTGRKVDSWGSAPKVAEFGPNSATSNQTLDPTVPYDPELADPDARHYQGLKRPVLQEASLISGLTLRDTRNLGHLPTRHRPGHTQRPCILTLTARAAPPFG